MFIFESFSTYEISELLDDNLWLEKPNVDFNDTILSWIYVNELTFFISFGKNVK